MDYQQQANDFATKHNVNLKINRTTYGYHFEEDEQKRYILQHPSAILVPLYSLILLPLQKPRSNLQKEHNRTLHSSSCHLCHLHVRQKRFQILVIFYQCTRILLLSLQNSYHLVPNYARKKANTSKCIAHNSVDLI